MHQRRLKLCHPVEVLMVLAMEEIHNRRQLPPAVLEPIGKTAATNPWRMM